MKVSGHTVITCVSLTFSLDGTGCFGQSFDFEPVCRFEECRQLVLRDVHLARIHKFQDGLQVAVCDIL